MFTDKETLEMIVLSSLDKVFNEGPSDGIQISEGMALIDEKFSFQVAFKGSEKLSFKIESSTLTEMNVFEVGQVMSHLPVNEGHDEDILKGIPGLFPDVLYPVTLPTQVNGTADQWHSFWIEIPANSELVGNHQIDLIVEGLPGQEVKKIFTLTVLPLHLPPQKLIHTEWFHTDGMISYYGVEVFSDAYWDWVEKYLVMAVEHGVNMILTPIVTPPLDTEIGGERPTVQLVGIKKNGDLFTFDFTQLNRWSKLCRKVGIKYLEMAHLYTQWGAKAAPKIMVEIDGEEEQLFGWETDASGSAYREFLKQFIPHLINWIEENDWKDQTFFHTSDEPTMENITSYAKASQFLRQLIGDIPVIDALSDYDFYQENLVDIPIPASDHIEPFIENKIRPLWVYYCVSQNKKVSNRFFDMPSYRNRIIGYQLYKYDIQGFLHWGYNFYFTQFSKQAVDPFTETDAGGNFASGDSFLVYPGKNQPLPSIRLKVFNEALQDLRVLHLLESYIGKEAVIELLEKNIEPLTFSNYPRNSQWQLKIKTIIYRKLLQQQN